MHAVHSYNWLFHANGMIECLFEEMFVCSLAIDRINKYHDFELQKKLPSLFYCGEIHTV